MCKWEGKDILIDAKEITISKANWQGNMSDSITSWYSALWRIEVPLSLRLPRQPPAKIHQRRCRRFCCRCYPLPRSISQFVQSLCWRIVWSEEQNSLILYLFNNIWIFWHEVAGNLWCIKFLNCEGYAQPSKCAVDRLSIALENERLTIEQISVVSYYCDHLKFRISEEKRQTRVHCSEVFNQNWLFLAQPA